MHDLRRRGRSIAAFLALAVVLAACSSAGASSTPSTPATMSPDAPVTSPPDDGVAPPPVGDAKVVTPRPGQIDVHPVSAESLAATVEGRDVAVTIDWWSGVEPCTILDSIVVEVDDAEFAVTLREGRGPEEVACIAIAELHRTTVDLGELAPGTYTIRDGTGGAPAIEVVVS